MDHAAAMINVALETTKRRAAVALERLEWAKRSLDSGDFSAYRADLKRAREWVEMASEAQARAIGWASR
jgi:hypothetical protein